MTGSLAVGRQLLQVAADAGQLGGRRGRSGAGQVEDDALVLARPARSSLAWIASSSTGSSASSSSLARPASASRRNSSRTPGRKSSSRSTAAVRFILSRSSVPTFSRKYRAPASLVNLIGWPSAMAFFQYGLERLHRLAADEVEVLVASAARPRSRRPRPPRAR